MTAFRLVLLAAMLVSSRAFADPIFPDGGTIGLEPPAGMAVEKRAFVEGGASITVKHMVKEAYARSLGDREVAASIGGPAVRVDPFPVGAYAGTIIRGRRMLEGVDYRVWFVSAPTPDETAAVEVMVPVGDTVITDEAIEAALRTIVVRPPSVAARLYALKQAPIVTMAMSFLVLAGVCGFFMSIGAALFGPKAGGPSGPSQDFDRGTSQRKGWSRTS